MHCSCSDDINWNIRTELPTLLQFYLVPFKNSKATSEVDLKLKNCLYRKLNLYSFEIDMNRWQRETKKQISLAISMYMNRNICMTMSFCARRHQNRAQRYSAVERAIRIDWLIYFLKIFIDFMFVQNTTHLCECAWMTATTRLIVVLVYLSLRISEFVCMCVCTCVERYEWYLFALFSSFFLVALFVLSITHYVHTHVIDVCSLNWFSTEMNDYKWS